MRELIDYLKGELGSKIFKVKAIDVRIGVVYTGVVLSTGYAGVAYTPIHELTNSPTLTNAGAISGKPASQLVDLALSSNLIEAAVGVATMNALSQIVFEEYPDKYIFSDIDVLDLIHPGDKVVTVGYFGPLIPRLLEKSGELYVLEKREIEDERVSFISPSEVAEVLPFSDVILITGSTLVNKTIDEILRFRGRAREVVLLGPTASVTPQPLFRKGVTAVMGIKILDPRRMMRIISEAGGTRHLLSTCAKKTAFIKKMFNL